MEKLPKKRIIPTLKEYDVEKSEYAGREPEFKIGEVIMTSSNKKAFIMDYLKDEGLYVVTNIDNPDETSVAYKVNPDKLKKIV